VGLEYRRTYTIVVEPEDTGGFMVSMPALSRPPLPGPKPSKQRGAALFKRGMRQEGDLEYRFGAHLANLLDG
jgi:hypothetical protein